VCGWVCVCVCVCVFVCVLVGDLHAQTLYSKCPYFFFFAKPSITSIHSDKRRQSFFLPTALPPYWDLPQKD
jgi:hypothetical protein